MKILLPALLAACIAHAQDARVQPKFEVASIKRAVECFGGANSLGPGSVTLAGLPLKLVMMEAFKVKVEQIEGPLWLETECFDISAKAPPGAATDQVPAMLQALLAERFKMTARKESRQRPGYALVVDKGGPKLKEDDAKAAFMRTPDGRQLAYIGRNGHGALKGALTMAALAGSLSSQGIGPVEDATGLTGKYAIDLSWSPDAPLPQDPGGAPSTPVAAEGQSLFSALREQLGLRLERRGAAVEYVVIDHIERTPTEN
jgi:uncharacterized protein (TIGR03435 family)